jgi:F420-dependent NADP oxidoreductase-like protein
MKIGIMGAGNMGAAFARRLAAADHEVAIAAQGLDEARKVASEVGHRVRAVPREELADGIDLLILATPYGQSVDALRAVRHTDGKTVIDISNPLTDDMSGLVVGHTTSAAEEIQRAAPRVKVVRRSIPCSRRCWGQSLAATRKCRSSTRAMTRGPRIPCAGWPRASGSSRWMAARSPTLATSSRSACSTSGSGTWAAGARTSRRGGTPPRQLSLWPSEATYSRGGLPPYFPSIIMLPSMSLSEP